MIKNVPATAKIARYTGQDVTASKIKAWWSALDTESKMVEFVTIGNDFPAWLKPESMSVIKSIGVLVTAFNKFKAGNSDWANPNTGRNTPTATGNATATATAKIKGAPKSKNLFVRVLDDDRLELSTKIGDVVTAFQYHPATQSVIGTINAATIGAVCGIVADWQKFVAGCVEIDSNRNPVVKGWVCGESTSTASPDDAIKVEHDRLVVAMTTAMLAGDFDNAKTLQALATATLTATQTGESKLPAFIVANTPQPANPPTVDIPGEPKPDGQPELLTGQPAKTGKKEKIVDAA